MYRNEDVKAPSSNIFIVKVVFFSKTGYKYLVRRQEK